MLMAAVDFLKYSELTLMVNFLCHCTIFFGGGYIALHCRVLPLWLVTPMWYMGLSSLIAAGSILMQWVFGPSFPLSYASIGVFGEIALNISLSIAVALMFLKTIRSDIEGSKNRRTS